MSDPCYLQIRVKFFSKNRIGFRLFFYGNTAVHNNIGTGHDLNCRKSSVVVGIIGGIRAGALCTASLVEQVAVLLLLLQQSGTTFPAAEISFFTTWWSLGQL